MCVSTHGGAGYADGSYWDGFDIICGGCGYRIQNPAPIGGMMEHFGFLGRQKRFIPTWPEWILGKRGEACIRLETGVD
jgi:hypothetical protein